jgi:hypothetical protein
VEIVPMRHCKALEINAAHSNFFPFTQPFRKYSESHLSDHSSMFEGCLSQAR